MSSEQVICRVGDVVRCGNALTIESAVDPAAVADAVRRTPDSGDRIAVRADSPPPVYDHVGYIRPEMGLRIRTALAKAARTLELDTPYDETLAEARAELAELTVTDSETVQYRRKAAQATSETEKLREQVATERGRLQARRENGLDPTPATEALADAIRQLSETETSETAARQHLRRERTEARARRDRREKRFRLEDQIANLERKARTTLLEQVRDSYVETLRHTPGGDSVSDPFDVDPVTAALAIVHLTDSAAPVVLACDRFGSARAASDWLGVPVLHV